MYEQFAKSYVLPSLGSVPLQELIPSHLDRPLHPPSQPRPRRPATHGEHGPPCSHALHKALDDAVRKGEVVRNVAAYADQPPVPRREMKVWWPE